MFTVKDFIFIKIKKMRTLLLIMKVRFTADWANLDINLTLQYYVASILSLSVQMVQTNYFFVLVGFNSICVSCAHQLLR